MALSGACHPEKGPPHLPPIQKMDTFCKTFYKMTCKSWTFCKVKDMQDVAHLLTDRRNAGHKEIRLFFRAGSGLIWGWVRRLGELGGWKELSYKCSE